jgi:hypothetical protein
VVAGGLPIMVRARNDLRAGVAIAAMVPVLFLLFNRVFSPQYLVVMTSAWAVAGSLFAHTAGEQLLFGLPMLFASGSRVSQIVLVEYVPGRGRARPGLRLPPDFGQVRHRVVQHFAVAYLDGPRTRGVTEQTLFRYGSSPSFTVVADIGRR